MESQKTKFSCPECGKEFRQKYNMNAHIRTSHEGRRYLCDKCTRSFTSNQNLKKHKCALSQSMTEYRCAKCPMVFSSPRELAVHVRSCHATTPNTGQPTSSGRDNASSRLLDAPSTSRRKTITQTPRCRICQRQFESWTSLYRHQMEEEHRQLPGSSTQSGRGDTSVKKVLQATPWRDEGAAPWEDETTGEVTEPGLRDPYNLNAPFILARDRVGEVSSIFNLPVAPNFSISELMERARDIYQSTHYSFRLNLAFGVILRNVETGDYRYFNPYENNPFFTNPIYITGVKDLEKLRQRLESMDLISHLLTQRPDTKWKPVLITNVNFYIYRSNFPLGHPPVTLPDYIKDHQAIISLDCNDRGQPYKDHLCAFRCLALYLDPEGRCSLEKPTKALYYKWVVYCRDNQLGNLKEVTPDQYTGLPSSDLPHFEDCFRVNVSVFCLDEDKIAQPKYKTRGVFKEHMYLNLHEKHLSLITKINVYCKRYRCQVCSMLFKRSNNCNRHQRNCTGQTKLRFPGGFHQTPKTVFDHLEENGLSVDASERYFPWFVVFDFESFLSPIDNGSEKLRWTQAHHPISVSICSNVEGFTSPHCIVDSDTDKLIASMLEYMKEIAEKVSELAREKWAYQLTILKGWSSDDGEKTTATCSGTISEDSDSDSDSEEGEEKVGKQTGRKKKTPKQLWQKQMYALYSKLMGYCSQVPVLVFNSARYDLNIIKEKLPKHLALDTVESRAFTVKKSNAYLCQSNDTFKFLDVTQYLSPGTNYSQFLKAFGVTEKKGFFPYEYLDTPEKLNETRLPPLGEAWYSNLKQKSVLDDGLKSIEENYAELEVIWEREGMTTFRDFLVWYNNLDVGPFVQAVEAMQRFYFEDGIDLFKTTMSVPGVARQKLYRESQKKGVTFALFDKYNEDLYHTMKANVVGGPSIIFTRYHKANQTFIRDNPQKRCKRVVGYDANALYLWAIDQPMRTGPFVRRRAETGFKPERRDKYMSMFYWMDWMRDKKGWDIRHKLNWGREKRVGPFLVDGWIPSSNPGDEKVILEYNGCFMHGHQCHLTQKAREDEKTREMLTRRFERTQTRAEYIRELGYTLVEKWECDFLDDRKANPELRAFIRSRQPPFYQKHGWKISDRAILQGVETGELFGMVEVDIRVPDQWSPGQNPHGTRLSPYEYFEEMTPLFCNAEVPFESLGEHMQNYIKDNDLSTKPRLMLVGGLKARKMLIATPLLQWYLQHGMVVDRVYQVIEYTPNACFQGFVRDVCSARREADRDPSASIRGDTAKLTGNSAYGSVLINKEKHQTVSYVSDSIKACQEVNLPQFRKLTELGEGYFEVEKAKKVLTLDTPMQLGYYILQMAKLHMLRYYFDMMDVYVDRSDFEYIEMDTDSAYMALSGRCLSDVIKPSKREAYQNQLTGFCVNAQEQHEDNGMRWFPRTCCTEHARYDKRTPGLFKLEYEGDEMIGLCSKTYLVAQSNLLRKPKPAASLRVRCAQRLVRRARHASSKRVAKKTRLRSSTTRVIGYFDRRVKFSCKGISKRTLTTPLKAFRHVLRTGVPGEGMNRGFRLKGNTMCSYQQTRRGLSYLYCKRRVLDDGIHTVPLDIELSPWPLKNETLDDTDTFLVDILNELVEN